MKEDREIIPLRTILQNCLNHIENLESNRSICDNYEKEFQDLKQFSETLKVRKEFACTEGEKEVNRKKNRYKDILPFNVSRVILSKYAGIPGSDYINANFIKGASGSPAYIASQGPLPNTVNDFWRMVVECEVQVIVMACNAEEAGKHKCENYWVEKEGEEKRFGMVEICLVKASTVCPDFLVRTMRLKYTNDKSVTEERTICQFHYSAWPDHGVPPLVRPLLDMVRLVRDTQASETLPVLVHCSAGCGRTGTICAIDFVWGLLRAGKLTEEFSLFNLVKDMRKQRVAMVQTKEQYILVHQAVRELFKEQLRVIESHPYENIDVNGVPLIKDFEEPLYDTIGPCKNNCDEKHDENEAEKTEIEKKEYSSNNLNKSDVAPPLPRKKRPNIPFSKHEKEVENFTEKNRCTIMEKEKEILDVSPSNSLLSKPRIAKLKALFERSPTNRDRTSSKHRGSQTVSRSHSLGAIRKPLFSEAFDNQSEKPSQEKSKSLVVTSQPSVHQPIPDGGKLKVPKLSISTSTVISKPVPLIKRSKSLKTISQPQKLSTPLVPSVEPEKPKIVRPIVAPSRPETISKATFIKSVTARDIPKAQYPNELYKRRRSLESLIGDEPPVITWPTAVMFAPVNSKTHSSKIISETVSSKQPMKSAQGTPAEFLRQQFQNLTVEAQKRMNTLVSGIGVRERRNSFRQAISKDDGQLGKQNRPYEYIWLDPKRTKQKLESKTIQVQPYPKNFNETLTVRNQNGEILHPPCDQTDGGNGKKEEMSHNLKPETSGNLQQNKVMVQQQQPCLKTQVTKLNSDVHLSRFPQRPHELMRTLSSHAIPEKGSAFSVVRSEDSRRSAESKNLFLQRLNIEIQERKNFRKHSGNEGKPEQLKSLEPNKSRSSQDAKRKEPNRKETDWNYGRPSGTVKVKTVQSRPNPNFLGVHAFGKESESQKVKESQIDHRKINPPVKNECAGIRRIADGPFKDSYVDLDSNVHRAWIPEDSEYYQKGAPQSSYPKKTAVQNRKPQLIEIRKKNYISGTNSVSSHSSGDMSRSDQHSQKSDSPRIIETQELEGIAKPEIIRLKSKLPDMRTWMDDCSRGSESSSSSSARELASVLPSKPPEEVYNYGIVASVKLKPNKPNHSRDDFVLGEPVAPPRVKRHASVKLSRQVAGESGATHLSAWTAPEKKMVDTSNWNDALGVDLDAVAASMQRQKAESAGEPSNLSKSHSSTTQFTYKKQQHYL